MLTMLLSKIDVLLLVVVLVVFVSLLLQPVVIVHASSSSSSTTSLPITKSAFVFVERQQLQQQQRGGYHHTSCHVDPTRIQSTYCYYYTTRIKKPSFRVPVTVLYERKNPMKRPFLDQLATTLFQLETKRVESSSVIDDQGRYGEPMEWSNRTSLANQFSVLVASNPIGYTFKQMVANLVAGNYNEEEVTLKINQYIQQDTVVMFSFTTCPFCRKAKDILDERNIKYTAIELDIMDGENNMNGNTIRAQLGKLTKRTSMPNIFIRGKCIGGCNDGYPGLIPLIEQNQLDGALL